MFKCLQCNHKFVSESDICPKCDSDDNVTKLEEIHFIREDPNGRIHSNFSLNYKKKTKNFEPICSKAKSILDNKQYITHMTGSKEAVTCNECFAILQFEESEGS